MTPIEILIYLIKESEGCRLMSYRDPAGIWTIGWGCTGKNITENTAWTKEYADNQLEIRATTTLESALRASPTLANQSPARQAAIADFIYNVGIGAYKKSTLKKYVDQSQWQHARMELLKWNHAEGRVLPGLTKRRQKEAKLLV